MRRKTNKNYRNYYVRLTVEQREIIRNALLPGQEFSAWAREVLVRNAKKKLSKLKHVAEEV